MINFKVGIMGAGKIAGVIADTLKDLDAFEAYAIASRDTEKAAAFAKEHGVTKYYGSYEELVADRMSNSSTSQPLIPIMQSTQNFV